MDEWLLSRLVCPERRDLRLRPVQGSALAPLNTRIASGGLLDRGGKSVSTAVEAGLLREDGKVLYRVSDGIPDLVPEDGIEVRPRDLAGGRP